MFLISADRRVGPSAAFEVARLDRLITDLRRYAAGLGPSPAELAEAPLLQDWSVANHELACLKGRVTGHPVLRGPHVLTTEIWAICPAHGYARTLSRLYRLGQAADDTAELFAAGGRA